MELNFSLENISAAASLFLKSVHHHKVIALHGDMGAGKTTFVHALCIELGVSEPVSSPTYSIINQYEGSNKAIIYHIDLYRLRDEEEALQAGVEDCLYSGNWCFVEWPERALGIFPTNTLHINLTTLEINSRKLVINL